MRNLKYGVLLLMMMPLQCAAYYGADRAKYFIGLGCEEGAKEYTSLAVWLSKSYTAVIASTPPNTDERKTAIRRVDDLLDDSLNKYSENNKASKLRLEESALRDEIMLQNFDLFFSGKRFALNGAVQLGKQHEDKSEATYVRLIEEGCKART